MKAYTPNISIAFHIDKSFSIVEEQETRLGLKVPNLLKSLQHINQNNKMACNGCMATQWYE